MKAIIYSYGPRGKLLTVRIDNEFGELVDSRMFNNWAEAASFCQSYDIDITYHATTPTKH